MWSFNAKNVAAWNHFSCLIHVSPCVVGTIDILADFSATVVDSNGIDAGSPDTDLVVEICSRPSSTHEDTNACVLVSIMQEFIDSVTSL